MERDLKKLILNKLLSKYERSKTYLNGPSSRRIMVSVSGDSELGDLFENTDSREAFLGVLEELKGKELLDYSWVRFEKGNLVDRIWLNADEEALKESSILAGRSYGKQQAEVLRTQIEKTLDRIRGADRDGNEAESAGQDCSRESRAKIIGFLEKMSRELSEKKKTPRYFFQEEAGGRQKETDIRNQRLLKLLEALTLKEKEELERVLSTRLYGDSKYLERDMKPKLLAMLRSMEKETGAWMEETAEKPSDEAILAEYGLVKWPEILEFCGGLTAMLPQGSVDFSLFMSGACMNAHTLRDITDLHLKGIRKILTIENKANYTAYICGDRKKDELVIYHAGFLSPARRMFLKRILEAAADEETTGEKIQFYHWGDVDLGGFSMLLYLRRNFTPDIRAFRMDQKTLEENRSRCMTITDQRYLNKLAKLRKDSLSDSSMRETIDFMLKNRLRLEQEVLV